MPTKAYAKKQQERLPTCQDTRLAVDDAGEDGVKLSFREAIQALCVTPEAVRIHHGVVHLDCEGDRHVKWHQVLLRDAARTQD